MKDAEKQYGTLVTDTGTRMITNATMTGEKVNITQFAVGDGGGAYYQPEKSMTALKHEVWRGAVGSASINALSPNIIDIVTVIPSDVGGFTIREMGVFDGAHLIAVCNTADIEKVIIASGEVSEIKLTMHIAVSNTSVIQFLVDPSVITATKKDLKDHARNTNIHVSPEQTQAYNRAIEDLGDHVNHSDAHVQEGERAGWAQTAETAEAAFSMATAITERVNEHEARIARLEDAIFSNITANPFLITFENLEGINITKGIWNRGKKRLEC